MANKPLKSIKFPGLNDTYTVPEVDATLATTGAAADAKKVGDEINDLKADLSYKDVYVYFSYGHYATWYKDASGFHLTLPSNADLIIFYGENGRKTVPVSDILTMATEYGLTVTDSTVSGGIVVLVFNIETTRVYFSDHVGKNEYALYYGFWGSAVWGKICDNYYYNNIVRIDNTLTLAGQAADSKATGNKLTKLSYKDIYLYFSNGKYSTWEKKSDGFYLTLPANSDLIIFYGSNGKKTVSVADILAMATEYGLTVSDTTIKGNIVILLFNIETATVYFSDHVGENDYVLYYAFWGSAVWGKICDNYYYLISLDNKMDERRNTWYAYTAFNRKWSWNKNDGKCHLYIPNSDVTIRGVGIKSYIKVTYDEIMTALGGFADVTITDGYVDGYEFSIVYDTADKTVKVHANNNYASTEIILFAHHWEVANYGLLTHTDPGYDGLRNYWLSHMESKIDSINANLGEAGVNGVSFMFITDIHIESNDGQSPRLIKEITNKTNVKYLIPNGDYVNQNVDKQVEIDNIRNTIWSFINASRICFPVIGNHDKNTNFAEDTYKQYEMSDAEVFDCVHGQLPYGTQYGDLFYYYYDDHITKTRFLILQSGLEHYTWAGQITQAQLNWARTVMDDTPSGYHIVIFVHALYQPADWSQLTPTFNPEFLTADGAALFNEVDGHNTAHQDAPIVAIFSGHVHIDMTTTTDGGVPIIFTDCDARSTNSGNYHQETTDSQCFDCVTINYTTKTIKCVRIGRGVDRTVTY